MKWLGNLLLNALLFVLLAKYLNGVYVSGFTAALGASVLLALLNVFVKPVLILLTLPVTLVTLGLFVLVINAVTLMLTDWFMGSSFELAGFGTALVAAFVMALLNMAINHMLKKA
ncbi:phage holin family protein [Peribacillus sp. SCS-26]|uniref:phage holin family protein n=1 Tax=Paraperibacillus marinus TaxID=3115295 RepID=UPI0039064F38